VLFYEQLGITEEQMKKSFTSQWTGKIGKHYPFRLLRKRKFNGTNYVTIDMVNEYDDYGYTSTTSADVAAIVTNCTAYRRLLGQVQRGSSADCK
jgi:hypothetical protein